MADNAAPLPDMSDEGISTLSAQLTRRQVDRHIERIKELRKMGIPESSIEQAMAKDLKDYDAHTLARLRQLATGGEIPDDFTAAQISGSKQPKPNTMELTFSAVPKGITLHSLVRYQ